MFKGILYTCGVIIFSLSSLKSYQKAVSKDEVIFKQGDKGGYIFMLLSGVVFLEKEEKFISDIAVYSFFGESGVVGECIYDINAVCQVPGYILRLPQDLYDKIVSASPDISQNMLQTIIERKY